MEGFFLLLLENDSLSLSIYLIARYIILRNQSHYSDFITSMSLTLNKNVVVVVICFICHLFHQIGIFNIFSNYQKCISFTDCPTIRHSIFLYTTCHFSRTLFKQNNWRTLLGLAWQRSGYIIFFRIVTKVFSSFLVVKQTQQW